MIKCVRLPNPLHSVNARQHVGDNTHTRDFLLSFVPPRCRRGAMCEVEVRMPDPNVRSRPLQRDVLNQASFPQGDLEIPYEVELQLVSRSTLARTRSR